MRHNGSLLWILFLLAALFLGPTVIMRKMTGAPDAQRLRTLVEQEQLIDAPRNDPSLPAAGAQLDKR